jgi:hypothetical protein
MAARKKKKEWDWSVLTGTLTIVTWLATLLGASYGAYSVYQALFYGSVLEVSMYEMLQALAVTFIPYAIYKLFSDMV